MDSSLLIDEVSCTQQSLATNAPKAPLGGTAITGSRPSNLAKLVALLAERDILGPWYLKERNLNASGLYRASGGFFDIFDDAHGIVTSVVYRRQRKPDYRLFEREIYALARDDIKSHINIVQIKSWGFDYPSFDNLDVHPMMMIEKAIGSLKTFLASNPRSIAIKHQLCLDVAEGLRHVHSCNIVHGDLKPDNVLIVESANPLVPFTAKLADFGAYIDLGVANSTSLTYSSFTGTQGWKPPELYSNEARRNEAVPLQLFFKCESYVYGLLLCSVILQNGQRPIIPDNRKDLRIDGSIGQPFVVALRSRIFQLLSPKPELRPDVGPQLLCDDSETYKNWASGKKVLERDPDPSNPTLRRWLQFWRGVDTPFFSQLYREYNMDSSSFSGASLFGLAFCAAFRTSRENNQERLLGLLRAAAQATCLAAKGIFNQVSRACGSALDMFSSEELQQGKDWLLEAAASGSFTALWQLRQISASLEQQAWEKFRRNGGFSGPESPIGISPRPSAGQEDSDLMRFHEAAIYGTCDDILRLSDSFNINRVDTEGQTALYKAAKTGNFETLQALIVLNADASITTAVAHISCLHWLFMFDSGSVKAVVKMLCSRSARLSARTNTARIGTYCQHILFEHFPFHWPIGSPIHWACFARSIPAIQALIQAGVDVNELDSETDNNAQTPLGMAMYRGDLEVVSFLLQCGANASRVDGGNRNPLHMLALDSFQNRLFRIPKRLYWWCNHGAPDLHAEIVLKCVNLVVAAGGDINARRNPNQHGNTPLLDAIQAKDGGVALALLQAGADASLCDELEILPIHHWVSLDGGMLIYPGLWESVLCMLMDLSPQTYETDYLGEGVFHHAVSNPSFHHFRRTMEVLLESPLRKYVVRKNDHGYTLLKSILLGKMTGGEEIQPRLDFLLDHDGAVVMDNEDIGDLLWTACRNDSLRDQSCLGIVKRLLHLKDTASHDDTIIKLYGNEPGILARDKGTNVLMMAVLTVNYETVKFLLRPTIDLQILSISGLTVLDYALHRAEKLRRTGLERWSTHAPQGEPPRHRGHIKNRDPNSFKELFWAGEILSNETVGGETSIFNKENYFAIMDIVNLIIERGGKSQSPSGEDSNIARPRQFDAEIVEVEDWGSLYKPEEQPYYDMWKPLYEFDK